MPHGNHTHKKCIHRNKRVALQAAVSQILLSTNLHHGYPSLPCIASKPSRDDHHCTHQLFLQFVVDPFVHQWQTPTIWNWYDAGWTTLPSVYRIVSQHSMRSAVCSEVPSPRAPRYCKAILVVAAKSDIFRGLHDLPKTSRASRVWGWRAPRGWTGLLDMENVTWEKTIRSHCTVHAWYQIDWLHHVQLQLQESLVVEVWVKNRLTENHRKFSPHISLVHFW